MCVRARACVCVRACIVQWNQLMLETIFLPSLTLNIILNGDEKIDTHGNIELREAVYKYIAQTNRF